MKILEFHSKLPEHSRYVFATLIFLIAFALRFYLLPIDAGFSFITFYPAVVITCYLYGVRACAFVAILSAISADLFFMPRLINESSNHPSISAIAITMFLLSAYVICVIVNKMQEYSLKLHLSEQRYLGLLQDQTEVICRFNFIGDLLFVNDAFCMLFGKSKESLIGKSWMPLVFPEDLSYINENIKNLSPNSDQVTITNRIIDTTGNIHWMQFLNRAFFDEHENLLEVQSVGRDITGQKVIEAKLATLSIELNDLYDNAPCGYHSLDEFGVFQNINQTELDWLGLTKEEVIGKRKINDFFTKDSKAKFTESLQILKKVGYIENIEIDLINAKGIKITLSMNATAITDDKGIFIKSRSVLHDITKLKNLQNSLQEKTLEQQLLLDNELVGMIKLNNRRFTWANKAMHLMFGYKFGELEGQSVRLFYPSDDKFEAIGNTAYPILNNLKIYRSQLELIKKNGESIWVDISGQLMPNDSSVSIWTMIDITDNINYEKKVEHIAYHDILTGLPNRLLISDRLNQVLANVQRTRGILAVCFLDLDAFKPVNDKFGHEAGDKVLIEVAKRIKKIIRTNDTVGRLGGDEYVMLLTSLDNDDYIVVLDRLIQSINEPIRISEKDQVTVGASIGVTLFPNDDVGPDALLRHADRAMYQAKEQGRNQICLFKPNNKK